MKKFLLLFSLMFIVLIVSGKSILASVATGHDNISKVEFEGDGKILAEITKDQINESIKGLGKKAFGWKTVYFNYKRKIKYEGEIIFSKINRSTEPIVFEYEMNDEQVATTSTSASGSISTKVSGTIKKIQTAITVALSGDIVHKNTKESSTVKTTKIDINIMPGKKLTLLTKGDAYITTAYGKYFFFGITLRKGTWETITIDTVFYELIEENVE